MGKRQKTADEPLDVADDAADNGQPKIMRSSTDWIPEKQLEEIVRDFYRRKGVTIHETGVVLGKDEDGMIFAEVTAEQQPFAFKTRTRKAKEATA